MLGMRQASNSLASVPSSLLLPYSSQSPLLPFVPTAGSVISRAMRPTRAFGLFVCSWVWFTRVALEDKAMQVDFGGVPKTHKITGGVKFLSDRKNWSPQLLASSFLESKAPNQKSFRGREFFFFSFPLGRPPKFMNICSEHKNQAKMVNFTYHFVTRYERKKKKKIWSRHVPIVLLCPTWKNACRSDQDVYFSLVVRV